MKKFTTLELDKKEILSDYKLANLSRQISLLGRKEVHTGKAKFGIFGDGKELVQLALAKQFKIGDWRSGYYRDQTWMMAAGIFSAEEFFHQLYGQTDPDLNKGNGGRSFNNHFSTPNIDNEGNYIDLANQKNTSADISPTAGQMPRLLGLAQASKLFRENKELGKFNNLSTNGNEVAFGSIGDASTSEGHFWETMNAAAVLKVPLAMTVYDDGYGISVSKKYQTVRESISDALSGFEINGDGKTGIRIYRAKAWNYVQMVDMFAKGIEECRRDHIPVLFHVDENTQPQGHSTSGSHERYKSEERLKWEQEFDCIVKMREWIIDEKIAFNEELVAIEAEAKEEALTAKKNAWKAYTTPLKNERDELVKIINNRSCVCEREGIDKVGEITNNLQKIINPIRKDNISSVKKMMRHVCMDCTKRASLQKDLTEWLTRNYKDGAERYSSKLYVEKQSPLEVKEVKPLFTEQSKIVNGREILRDNWDILFSKYPKLVAFGEDVGGIGGVNQTFENMQQKYGELRVSDTGIREATIMGQGIGLALRGLRPVAEIQYFDYLLYALQTMSDDLATTHYRTAGKQIAPVIVSTRGHRLEGIWHSGSPLSMVINSIRGIHVCVPRNMTQAAGFYNTLLQGNDPALVIEPLNGYRLKETQPDNIGEFTIPLGVPEIMSQGTDVTLVTYGSCVRIAQEAVEQLKEFNISVELIDVQTLLPFDVNHIIKESVKKTSRLVVFDEDVPGGATAFMLQKIMEEQKAFYLLDSEPRTISAKEHRPAYATDGDYFSNPNSEDVFETIYSMMHERNPGKFPKLY